jgi:hypothetical protein
MRRRSYGGGSEPLARSVHLQWRRIGDLIGGGFATMLRVVERATSGYAQIFIQSHET